MLGLLIKINKPHYCCIKHYFNGYLIICKMYKIRALIYLQRLETIRNVEVTRVREKIVQNI